MVVLKPLVLACLASTCVAASPQQVPLGNGQDFDADNLKHVARENGPQIFNALHSSMRQFGSSLKHNGMSFFPAKVPAKTQFYHGTHTKERVTGMEWLAFEIEHAEMFARSRGGGPPGKRPGGPGRRPGGGPGERPGEGPERPEDPKKGPAGGPGPGRPPMDGQSAGYLHTYQTNRELSNLLYIDGMSAGKTSMGTLDTTDFVLRNITDETAPWGDYQRAQDLCTLGSEWNVEGFIRMEAGFEIILCNFTEGLDFVSAHQRPANGKPEGFNDLDHFEYVRGLAARYQGITAGRVEVDYSSMVSAFFYPLNLTNPDQNKTELPRLVSADSSGIVRLKEDIRSSLSQSKARDHRSIDWQGVVDMLVTRYSDRLQYLASNLSTQKDMLSDINVLLNVYIDYNKTDIETAKESCAVHYLRPVVPVSTQDHLLHEAILAVSTQICNSLFEVRTMLIEAEENESTNGDAAKSVVKELISRLDWSTWLECGKCAYNEVCFVAIWPWGSLEDHEHPSCLKPDMITQRHGYWNMDR